MKRIFVGAAYYPELWDESEIDKDIQRCKDLGINVLDRKSTRLNSSHMA